MWVDTVKTISTTSSVTLHSRYFCQIATALLHITTADNHLAQTVTKFSHRITCFSIVYMHLLETDIYNWTGRVSQCENIGGGVGKNSPTVLSRFWTNVHQILGACRSPCRLTNFFPIVDIMSRCRNMLTKIPMENDHSSCLIACVVV